MADGRSVISVSGNGELANEFITVGKTYSEALGRCITHSDKQRIGIVKLHGHMMRWNKKKKLFDQRIDSLTNLLSSSPTLGGFNRSAAGAVGTGIFITEAFGIKADKKRQKQIDELNKIKMRQGQNNNNSNEELE